MDGSIRKKNRNDKGCTIGVKSRPANLIYRWGRNGRSDGEGQGVGRKTGSR